MTRMHRLGIVLAAFSIFATQAIAVPSATAHDFKVGELAIKHPFSRATPKGAKTGAAYMTIVNVGMSADRLISAKTEISERAEIHRTTTENDIMKMRIQPGGIAISSAGGELKLQPGSEYHIMLVNLREPLQEGMRVPLVLVFEKAGTVTVELAVEALRKRTDAQSDHGAHGN